MHGNLGYSYYTQEPVKTILAQDLPITASVVVGGVVLWLIVGIGVGILSRDQGHGACSTGSPRSGSWPACRRRSSCSASC